MLGPWLPFPPKDWTEVPEGPGVYVLADGKETILAVASAPALRSVLQELAADPPLPLKDLATHLWVEATAEPERRRAELIAELRTHTGAFPPCNRRHPRYPARLPAWWAARGMGKGLPAKTLNVSSTGLLLALDQPPAPGAGIRVETPFGQVKAEGRIAWREREAEASRAGVALTRLRGTGDRVRWSNPQAGKTYPQGMGVKFVDLPGERPEQIQAFVAQVRRERGLDRVADLLGRPQEEQA